MKGMETYKNIECRRKEKELSKCDISKMLGISLKTYYNWLNGTTNIPSNKLIILAEILDSSIDFLLKK